MPQMSPMLWPLMMIIFTMIKAAIASKVYFSPKKGMSGNTTNNEPNSTTWKW